MIESAEEFRRLRISDDPEEYNRAAHGNASLETWLEVIERWPDMREWVAHNKTVPVAVLEKLAYDPDPRVRSTVATKNKLPEHLQLVMARDDDRGRPGTGRPLLGSFVCWLKTAQVRSGKRPASD